MNGAAGKEGEQPKTSVTYLDHLITLHDLEPWKGKKIFVYSPTEGGYETALVRKIVDRYGFKSDVQGVETPMDAGTAPDPGRLILGPYEFVQQMQRSSPNQRNEYAELPDITYLTLAAEAKVSKDVHLGSYSKMGMGGNAHYVVSPHTTDALEAIIKFLYNVNRPYVVCGNGSNAIFGDVNGVVILTNKLTGVTGVDISGRSYSNLAAATEAIAALSNDQPVTVEIAVGESTRAIAKKTSDMGLHGFERLYAIPGSIGGAVVMNAGFSMDEISEVVDTVRVIDPRGNPNWMQKCDMKYGNRSSILLSPGYAGYTVASARFVLQKKTGSNVLKVIGQHMSEASAKHDKESATYIAMKNLNEKTYAFRACGSFWVRRGYLRRDTFYALDEIIPRSVSSMVQSQPSREGPRIIYRSDKDSVVSIYEPTFTSWLWATNFATFYDLFQTAKRMYDQVFRELGVELVKEVRLHGTSRISQQPIEDLFLKVMKNRVELTDLKEDLNFR